MCGAKLLILNRNFDAGLIVERGLADRFAAMAGDDDDARRL